MPTDDEQGPILLPPTRPKPPQFGTYSRRNKTLLGRIQAQHGLTGNTQGDGVSMLDVCAFQSSV